MGKLKGEKGWITGSSSQILYVASGGSEDWAYVRKIPLFCLYRFLVLKLNLKKKNFFLFIKGIAKIKYSYCFELRPGQGDDDYSFGFTLPEDR